MMALGLVGCLGSDPVTSEPVWDMRAHQADVQAARAAIRGGDLAAARRAGEALARPDPAPGLPEAGRIPLDAVRDRAAAVASATSTVEAGRALVALTEPCAACHLAFGVIPAVPTDPEEALWSALWFESEAHWVAGVLLLPEGAARAAGRDWTARREVVARRLFGP